MMKKQNLFLTGLFLIIFIQAAVNIYLCSKEEVPKIHVLERPLLISSNAGNYAQYTVLPEGTVLYQDSDHLNARVKVYFNLQGVNFDFKEQDADILKQPGEVTAIRTVDLSQIMKTVPLTKKDIYLIIKHDEDISDAVRSMFFKKYKILPADYENKNNE